MTKEIEELRRQIESLESELMASMRREEMRHVAESGGGSLRQRIKNKIKGTKIWQAADDPNNKLGKVIRSPRTVARIVTNPSVVKEIRNKNKHVSGKEKMDIYVPIKFFLSEEETKRVNVVLEDEDLDLTKMGIKLANMEGIAIRIVGTKKKLDAAWYRKMVNDGKIPKANNISFYSTVEQAGRTKMFELEVSKNDIFLMKAWSDNGNT